MLAKVFMGCIVLLSTNISLLYASHLAVRRFYRNAPVSSRLVAFGVLYYSLIILLFQVLSPAYAITKIWVTILCLLTAVITHMLWGAHRNIRAEIEPIEIWIRDGLHSRWTALIICCGFVSMLSLSRALLMPPLAWDCLTYHLTFAALWIQKGTLFIFHAPDQIADNAYFPINGDIFASWLLLPFDSDLLVNTMNFPITLLGGIAGYAIARELGLSRRTASWAPALTCFAPVIYSQITTALSENALFTFYCSSVLFTLRYLLKGNTNDRFFALISAGMLVGIKQTGIPAAGLIFIVILVKSMREAVNRGLVKRLGIILSYLIILIVLGGRQYILNSFDARNPLYPFPVTVLGKEIFAGSREWEQHGNWVAEFEQKSGRANINWWEREIRRFYYIKDFYSTFPITAGPKFLLFFALALAAIVMRPPSIRKSHWYFLSLLWMVPLVFFYSNSATNIARKGPWLEYSTRFLSPFLALVTIMSLVVIDKTRKYLKGVEYFLAALVGWDLLYVNKDHIWEVRAFYPIITLIVSLLVIFYRPGLLKRRAIFSRNADLNGYSRRYLFSGTRGFIVRQCIRYTLSFAILFAGLAVLQTYRDTTRYAYFQSHYDHQQIPKALLSGWEFLDQPQSHKTIAMTMGDEPPDGHWFYYPLMGRRLQNKITYVSAKHKGEVPTWLDRGFIRGEDISIWLNNLDREKVDYILVAKPWPIELQWMLSKKENFRRVFQHKEFIIFKYVGRNA